jgi:hypothetical protein
MRFPFAGRAVRSEPDCNPWIIVAGAIGGTAHGDGRNAIGFAACASTVLNLAAS